MKRFIRTLVLGILGLALQAPLQALSSQAIFGQVLMAGDTLPVEGATVTLRDDHGRELLQVQSDARGAFRIPLDFPGTFRISASRIGLRTTDAEVVLNDREVVELELRMAQEAIPLEPLIITARRTIRQGTLDEFYDRMERNRRRGMGRFITREEVENSPTANTTLLLGQVPGVFLEPTDQAGWGIRMRLHGSYCSPDYYLDGLLTSWDRLPPMEDIEGVEIYRTHMEHVEGYWPSDCGMVFMWRKPNWGSPFSWTRLFIAAGFILLGIGLAEIW